MFIWKIHLFSLDRISKAFVHSVFKHNVNGEEQMKFFVRIHMKISMKNALFLCCSCSLSTKPRGKKERFVCIKKDTIKTIVIFKKDRSYLEWQNMLQNRMIYQWAHCLVNKCFECVSQFFLLVNATISTVNTDDVFYFPMPSSSAHADVQMLFKKTNERQSDEKY